MQSLIQSSIGQSNNRRFLSILYPLLFLLLLLCIGWTAMTAFAQQPALQTLYVDQAATGRTTGLSWTDAYTTVQDALAVAQRGDQIWVAAGVYYPDAGSGKTGNDRSASFTLRSGVALYGGFAGGERSLTERDWQQHVTVLSGDIDQNDQTATNGVVVSSSHISGSNSVHVVYLDGTTNAITDTTRIDGFVITAGQADGAQDLDKNGGGLLCNGFTKGECSPLLTNVIFSGNFAAANGGAMLNDGRNGGKSSPTLINVIFSGNSATGGGAIYNAAWDKGNGSPILTNVIFIGNSASWAGGALFNQGERNGNSSPLLTNVTFSGNSAATAGGAIYNYGGSQSATGTSTPTLKNVILWQNSATAGPSIYNQYGKSTISHSIVENGASSITGTITNSVVYDGSNTQNDPQFVQPINPASAPTSTGDLRLQPGSPAIDAGDNSAVPASITTDVDGNQRIANGAVDIGAYEFAELRLTRPEQLPGLIANLEARIQPVVQYTGYDELAFSLTEFPDNMTIDLSTGLIRWTPQAADEGKSYTVGVSVNDGSQFAETSFQVTVLAPEPLVVDVAGNTLRVVDESTTLNGMTITQLDGESLSALSIGKLAGGVAPARPEWVSLLSDVLVVRGSFDHAVALRFPLPPLPENVTLADVDLYAFTEAWDVEGQLWTSVWMEVDYEGTPAAPIVVVKLSGLQGMVAWGYAVPQAESSASAQTAQTKPLFFRHGLAAPIRQTDVVTCTRQTALNQEVADICTASNITVTIRGWGGDVTRWKGPTQQEAGATKEQLVRWLLAAQSKSLSYGLAFNSSFNIKIGPLPNNDGLIVPTDLNTLHLNDSITKTTTTMQAVAVHEYFHHVQMYTMTKSNSRPWSTSALLSDYSNIAWIMEGTAVWFEDQLNDTTDEYAPLLGKVGRSIAAAGMNSVKGRGLSADPYQRFSFFKLLTRSCPNFESKFHMVLDIDRATDPSGIKNLVSLFGNDHFACDFGNHLGASYASGLGAALAYYNYATQFKGKISLLDANESDTGFRFSKPNYPFSPQPTSVAAWLALPNSTITLTLPTAIPVAGAYSFKIPALPGDLPAGKVAELNVTGSGAITVSITSTDTQFIGTNTIGAGTDLTRHAWFTTTQKTEYVYSVNGKVPTLFVTLVNPSPTEKVSNLKVTWRLRNASLPAVSIREPQAGAQVSNRVITVTGTISESARISTHHVLVTANGISANAPIQPNGTFTAQVVVALGQNSIKVQGMGAQTPTTEEKVITVQGVATDSTARNALIASRAVFVLRWDTDATDIDIYTTDKTGASVWYSHTVAGPGTLDFDEQHGFGPEVISYRATDDELYVDGAFDVDIHYYAGSPPTHFTLDVILNETEPNNRRTHQYRSTQPLVTANADQHTPDGSGDSRFNNILRISCSTQRVCNLANFDRQHLMSSGTVTTP